MEDYRTYLKVALYRLRQHDVAGAYFQLGYACALIESGDAVVVAKDHAHREFYRLARRTYGRVYDRAVAADRARALTAPSPRPAQAAPARDRPGAPGD